MANRVSELLTDLAACLCAQYMEDHEGGAPAFCGIIPGEGVVAEYVDCDEEAMAWVRLTSVYPSTTVGQVDIQPGNCGKGLGLDIEIGILRCVGEDEQAPDEAELIVVSDLLLDDMLTMKKAVDCCDAVQNKDYILGQWVPSGPSGGIIGGTWNLFVGLL